MCVCTHCEHACLYSLLRTCMFVLTVNTCVCAHCEHVCLYPLWTCVFVPTVNTCVCTHCEHACLYSLWICVFCTNCEHMCLYPLWTRVFLLTVNTCVCTHCENTMCSSDFSASTSSYSTISVCGAGCPGIRLGLYLGKGRIKVFICVCISCDIWWQDAELHTIFFRVNSLQGWIQHISKIGVSTPVLYLSPGQQTGADKQRDNFLTTNVHN